MTTLLLETHNLSRAFKGLVALNNHTIQVKKADLLGVIGPNGSGKSTLFKMSSVVLHRPLAVSSSRDKKLAARNLSSNLEWKSVNLISRNSTCRDVSLERAKILLGSLNLN